MFNKSIPLAPILVGAVVLIGLSFYGGVTYQKKQVPTFAGPNNLTAAQRQQFAARAGGLGQRPDATAGEVISKDDKSITVKLTNGSTKVVYYSNTTKVEKSQTAKIDDVVVGTKVTVAGRPNTDSSVTAQNIQITQ